MKTQSGQEVLVSIENSIAWVRLNRPEVLNALNAALVEKLVSCLRDLEIRDDVRIIVLTGEGKGFCAGGDVKDMKEKQGLFAGDSENLRLLYKRGIQQISLALESISCPTIAMINDAAIGAGMDIACMCDLRYASENAKMGVTFSQLGLVPGDGGAFFLQRIVGYAKAMEMLLLGDVFKANDAKKFGLVHDVFSVESLKEEVGSIAETLAARSPQALSLTKKALQASMRQDLSSHLEMMAAFQGLAQRSGEHEAAVERLRKL